MWMLQNDKYQTNDSINKYETASLELHQRDYTFGGILKTFQNIADKYGHGIYMYPVYYHSFYECHLQQIADNFI